MKRNKKYVCKFEACCEAQQMPVTESDLKIFIDTNKANAQYDALTFEKFLQYTSVIYWGIRFFGDARFYVYRNKKGEFIAWYDTVKEVGYK